MKCFSGLNPPAEVLELGTPERVYRSPQVTSGMVIATYVMGTLAVLIGGGLIALKDVLGVIPEHLGIVIYVVSAFFVFGSMLMFVSLWLMRDKKPKYLYALYAVGLVIYQRGEWGLVPWENVVCLDEKHDPALVLNNQAVIPIVHDFPDWHHLIFEIRQYVLAKDGLLSQSMVGPVRQRRRGVSELLAGAALLSAAGITTFLTWDWMVEMNQPAQQISHEALAELRDPESISRGWVSIEVPQVIKTTQDMQQRRMVIFGVTEAKFVLIPIKDHFLVALVKGDFKDGKGLKGVLSSWRGETGRYSQEKLKALYAIMDAFPKHRPKMLPFQLDGTIPLEAHAKALPLGLGVAGFLGLGFFLHGWSQGRRREARVVM